MFFKNIAETSSAIQDDYSSWLKLVQHLRGHNAHVVALRGAGSINGMDPSQVDRLLNSELIPRMEALALDAPLAVMYDGDDDVPAKPDIGYIMGRLVDYFAATALPVIGVAVQKESWYSPPVPGGNLISATGKQYLTHVFPDSKYLGDHNAFSQGVALVALPRYQQWYVGASGRIAKGQLEDYNHKVPVGETRPAILFRLANNPALDAEIHAKRKQALADGNAAKAEKLEDQLVQRQHIYGVHWDNQGYPMVNKKSLPYLRLTFVS